MKLKGLSKEEAIKKLELVNKQIEFNNYINKEARKYMKESGLEGKFNGWHDSPTPEMIELMKSYLEKADFMPIEMKKRYIESTGAIFGRTYSIAVNRYHLTDRKDLEGYIKTVDKAQDNQEEENSLFKVERNLETTRMNLYFDGKPEDEIRDVLKHNGFKWSPKFSCWTRQLTENAEYSLKRVKEQLKDYMQPVEENIDENAYKEETQKRKEQFIKDITNAPFTNEEVINAEELAKLAKGNLSEQYTANDMQSIQTKAKENGYNLMSFDCVTGNYVTEKEGIIVKNDINGKEILFSKDELKELSQKAWHRTSEAGATDKDTEKALYFDNLLEHYDERFTILKHYPNIDYCLARANKAGITGNFEYVAGWKPNDNGNWEQGHYFTTLDSTLDYINKKEKEWLNSVDKDVLLDSIRDKFDDNEITNLENSIYNKDSGKEL